MHRVLVIGDANVDIIVPYPRFMNDERTLVSYPTPELQGGGTSANTAVALSRLGVKVDFLGTIGDDQYGRYIKTDLEKEGVSTEHLIVSPEYNTVGVFAFIDERGERYLWGWPRVNQAFKELDEKKIKFDRLKEMDWIHSSGMSLVYDTSARSSIIEVFKRAHELGIPTSFDLNLRVDQGKLEEKYAEAVYEILKYCTYILGSGTDEFQYLGDSRDWHKNAKALVRKDRVVIVRNGSKGSIAMTTDNEINMPAYKVKVEDTVGAGDVYNAGFITAMLLGKDMEFCLKYGNAVSGYTVQRKGSRSCPTLDELAKFMNNND